MDPKKEIEKDWKDEVREKLVEVFKNKDEDLARVLFFLDEEDLAYKDNIDRPYAPQWKSLKATLKIDKAFKTFAERLAEDTKRAEKDQNFRTRMNKVYEEMMAHCDDAVAEDKFQDFDFVRVANAELTTTSAFGGLARALSIIPPERQASIMAVIKAFAGNSSQIATAVDDVVSLANKAGGTVVMVALAAVHITYKVYMNIKRWWKGEISGNRCLKNVLDAMVSSAAGIGGGFAGAAVGSLLGPPGTVVGGIIGGWVSAAAATVVSDYLTQKLFGIPQEEALENAYTYLRVKMTASNAEVNRAFRQSCLQHHPDKGGRGEDFFILQCHMTVIKQARGDF